MRKKIIQRPTSSLLVGWAHRVLNIKSKYHKTRKERPSMARCSLAVGVQRWVFKDCFSRRDDLRQHENRFLGPTSTLETSFHAGVGCLADRNNL